MGCFVRGQPGCESFAEEPDWGGVSAGRRRPVPRAHPAVVPMENLEAAASVQRRADHFSHCRALAHSRDTSQSAVLRFHLAQRARRVSRIPLVLFHQRAGSALLEPALSTRLQHCPAPLFLAVPPHLAFSLERVLSRHCETLVPAHRPRRTRSAARTLLGWLHPGLFHVFHHAGILFDAVLSRARAAARLRHGGGRQLDSMGNARAQCNLAVRGNCRGNAVVSHSRYPGARRYLVLAELSSRCLFALARTYGGPDAQIVRLSARSAVAGCDCVSDWLDRDRADNRAQSVPLRRSDVRAVFPSRPHGAGGVRSLHVLAATRRSAAALPERKTNRRP